MRRQLLLTLLILTACEGGDGVTNVNTTYDLRGIKLGVDATTTAPAADADWLAFLASEAASNGTDLNGDGDAVDSVSVLVNTINNKKYVTHAARALFFVNRTLFLVVNEAEDGTNWNLDPDLDDDVLLFQRPGESNAEFLAVLSQDVDLPVLTVGDRLFFVSTDDPLPGETDLRTSQVVDPGAAPEVPVVVPTDDSSALHVAPLGSDDGLVFLTIDETLDGDQNGDGDADDTHVLALLDGVGEATRVRNLGLAVDGATPIDAVQGPGAWLAAFLVDEAGEGANLNDPTLFDVTWQPTQCAGAPDEDVEDNVLHWVFFNDIDPPGPVNTGLVGAIAPGEHVYVHPDAFVGVVSFESDEGAGDGCDLNADGDFSDQIFRWVDALDDEPFPVTDPDLLLALTASVPGSSGDSTGGVVVLGNLWVALVDEAADGRDYDNDPDEDQELLGALDPLDLASGWGFEHGGQGAPVGVTWMAADPQDASRFLAAISESTSGIDFNGDGDEQDSIPSFPTSMGGNRLDPLPPFGVATESTNAGIATANGVAYYRVSEADEGKEDLNGDGDKLDVLLQRLGVSANDLPTLMETLNNEDIPAVFCEADGTPRFAAFLIQEGMDGNSDLNDDGDTDDLVVRYFRLGK